MCRAISTTAPHNLVLNPPDLTSVAGTGPDGTPNHSNEHYTTNKYLQFSSRRQDSTGGFRGSDVGHGQVEQVSPLTHQCRVPSSVVEVPLQA